MMNWLLTLLAVAGLTACGTKPQKQCPSSSTALCVGGEVCDFNVKLGCQVCTCRPWSTDDNGRDRNNDKGPAGPPNAPGPPIPVH